MMVVGSLRKGCRYLRQLVALRKDAKVSKFHFIDFIASCEVQIVQLAPCRICKLGVAEGNQGMNIRWREQRVIYLLVMFKENGNHRC